MPETKKNLSTMTEPLTKKSEKQKLPSPKAGSVKGLARVHNLTSSPRRQTALTRFIKGTKVTLAEIEKAPHYDYLLQGNRKIALEAMRFSDEPCIVEFLRVYDSTPVCDRKQIPLEAVALKAGVNLKELLGAIWICFKNIQSQKSGIMAMANHPDILKKTIDFAKKPKGQRDRRMLHEAVGFLPTPKGANFNLNIGMPEPAAKEDADVDAEEPEVNDVFPVITNNQQDWQDGRQKLLAEKN